MSRFHTYLHYVQQIGTKMGYKMEMENLRIPSTRNIALVGSCKNVVQSEEEVKRLEEELLKKAKFKQFVPKFREDSKHRG